MSIKKRGKKTQKLYTGRDHLSTNAKADTAILYLADHQNQS
eukprot:gene5082-3668_t